MKGKRQVVQLPTAQTDPSDKIRANNGQVKSVLTMPAHSDACAAVSAAPLKLVAQSGCHFATRVPIECLMICDERQGKVWQEGDDGNERKTVQVTIEYYQSHEYEEWSITH